MTVDVTALDLTALPDSTGPDEVMLISGGAWTITGDAAEFYRQRVEYLHDAHRLTWRDLLLAGVFEAIETDDSTELRDRLHTLVVLIVGWKEAIVQREAESA